MIISTKTMQNYELVRETTARILETDSETYVAGPQGYTPFLSVNDFQDLCSPLPLVSIQIIHFLNKNVNF
jgi:hypothetical protein